MNRDPKVVGRARVGAETFAGVINSFVDPISWKTMGFTVVTLTFLIILTNSALFNLRAKHQHNHAPPPQQSQQMFPPWMGGQMNGMNGHMDMGQMGYGHQGMLGMPGQMNGNGHPHGGSLAPPGKDEKSSLGKALGWLKG